MRAPEAKRSDLVRHASLLFSCIVDAHTILNKAGVIPVQRHLFNPQAEVARGAARKMLSAAFFIKCTL